MVLLERFTTDHFYYMLKSPRDYDGLLSQWNIGVLDMIRQNLVKPLPSLEVLKEDEMASVKSFYDTFLHHGFDEKDLEDKSEVLDQYLRHPEQPIRAAGEYRAA